MTIGELSRRTGVAQSAIRYYESVGLLRSPGRLSGRRVYGPSAVTDVKVIDTARELGFGIREIQTLTENANAETPVNDRWRALAQKKLVELDTLIERATRMKQLLKTGLHCGCARIEDCILHDCKPQLLTIQR